MDGNLHYSLGLAIIHATVVTASGMQATGRNGGHMRGDFHP